MSENDRDERLPRDPGRPVYVISVAAELVRVHPRTLRIYELEGLICPSRTRTNIRLYSENDIRRVLWIRHLTRNMGVNLAGVRVLFELEERIGNRILETLYENGATPPGEDAADTTDSIEATAAITDTTDAEPTTTEARQAQGVK